MSLSWQHCTHLYYSPLSLCLTAAAHVMHLSTRTHTYRNIWTAANQRGGVRPSLSLIGLDHDISLTGVSESRILFFSFLEWLDAPVRPGIFVSRTREKLGRTCDQIGRTLEPCRVVFGKLIPRRKKSGRDKRSNADRDCCDARLSFVQCAELSS